MGRWNHPQVGVCRLVRPAIARLWDVDEDWPPRRPSTDANLQWRWAKIARMMEEVYAVLGLNDRVVALWGSTGLVQEGENRLYMLEFWEIEPDLRGSRAASFVLGLVACRARDRGCAGVLLHSLPETAVVYDRVGVPRRVIPAKPPRGDLISFAIEGHIFRSLVGATDALGTDDDADSGA